MLVKSEAVKQVMIEQTAKNYWDKVLAMKKLGRGGDQVVNVLSFYSGDPSSNPFGVNNFSVKIVVEQNENKQKVGQGRPILNNQGHNCPS